MRIILLNTFLLFTFAWSHAQTRIAGTVEQYRETPISLVQKDDFLSQQISVLKTDTIDQNGFFVLSSPIEETGEYFIKIEDRLTGIYLEPNSQYEVKLTPPENLNNRVSYIQLEYKAVSTKQQSNIANEILSFEDDINDFLYKNDVFINKHVLEPKTDTLKTSLSKKYEHAIQNWQYFKTSFDYQFATLYLLGKKSKGALYKEYVEEKNIDYNNQQQLLFLRRFYNNNFEKLKLKLHHEYNTVITSANATDSIITLLEEQELVPNKQYAEFILINAIKRSKRTQHIDEAQASKLLEDLSNNSEFGEHQKIAANLLDKRNKLKVGSVCPDFEAVNTKERSYTLEDEPKNRYIYLGFFSSWNRASILDLKMIQRMRKEFGKSISFVNVSLDRSFDDYKRFVEQNGYNWSVVHFNDDYSIFEDFEIKSFPIYFLIAPDGKIVQSPAERPSKNFEFFKQLKEMHSKGLKPYEIIENYED